MKEIAKQYDPKQVEDRLYKHWMEKGYFHAEVDENKKPFCIVMPPPNITGQLHMGHALDNMMQDAIIRFKRMQGYSALWLPGTDHASIATEVKIVDAMAKEGLKKEDLGREKFLERAWAWKKQYGGRIVEQLKKLGSSCDWERERFTMDEGCSKAVTEVFVKLYEKGLIYHGSRIINWCPVCKTALSDAEVEYEEQSSHLWHMRYFTPDGKDSITVATTRPETYMGDTAVAVHPDDERYTHLVGKTVVLPLMNREIPIVADSYVEMDFGSGAVKITPAHDPNDFEVSLRHNLPVIRVMNDDGTINEEGGIFAGLTREEAREEVVKKLTECGALIKTEDYSHNVGTCYRCHSAVEPIISKQWFVKMESLAKPALEAVKNGETNFVPDRFSKIYYNWLENIRDWCVSRQLWWGHRIPAYYCEKCGETHVAKEMPVKCSKCGHTVLNQDEDVLDTWFSSALWPFSTLGWPEKTKELDYYYPTNALITGYDIIFFWVARMMFSGIEQMGEVPFKTVLIHGIVRDSQGRKMSKSLGNGIDPLEVIDKYGADALRFSLASGNSPGNDMRFYWEKVEAYRNFANKIWNASRFVKMNIADRKLPDIKTIALDESDKWILKKFNNLVESVTKSFDSYELGIAAQSLYDFIWSEYCDWYIELTKPRLYSDDENAKTNACCVLNYVLSNTLKLLHPLMPFITEEIWTSLPDNEESIMISAWPEVNEQFNFDDLNFDVVVDIIKGVRNLRTEMNVPQNVKTEILVLTDRNIKQTSAYIEKLASSNKVTFINEKPKDEDNFASIVLGGAQVYIPMGELVDTNKEIERLTKEKATIESEIKRAQGKLNNQGFIAKAPQKLVDEEKAKVQKYTEMLEKVCARLNSLGEK
ncbi:MAG: valine--tRNA ligase [Clostridiales bacterium]|nr:valine--tRNA ligase [Clostridiales bacterium]